MYQRMVRSISLLVLIKIWKVNKIDQRDLKAGAEETANDADEYEKDNLADFVLWKAKKAEDGDNFGIVLGVWSTRVAY